MSRSQRPGPTADLVALLAAGPKHRDEMAAALGLKPGEVTQKLQQRMHHKGDVTQEGPVWRMRAGPAPIAPRRIPAPLQDAVVAARRTPDQAVRDRAAREIVCEVATSRTFRPPGEYRPPRMVIRDGAFDYLATPTRVGDARLPYRGATNMSTTATAAGARSGVK